MHSTLVVVVLLGCAILGSASPLASSPSSISASPLNDDDNSIISANKTPAGSQDTNNSRDIVGLVAQDPPAVAAPSLNDLPECCLPCVQDGIKEETECTLEDIACICKNKQKIGKAAKDCVVEKCGLNNAIKVVAPAVKKLCEGEEDKETEIWE